MTVTEAVTVVVAATSASAVTEMESCVEAETVVQTSPSALQGKGEASWGLQCHSMLAAEL